MCGGGGVIGCHMAWICGVVRGVLLQWNGVQGGGCARAGRREEREKEARVG